jgi:hypothetical protein
MREIKNDAFAIIIPVDQLANAPFHFPTNNAICQLYSAGINFHARSKLNSDYQTYDEDNWREYQVDHLLADLSAEELAVQFQKFHSKAIALK